LTTKDIELFTQIYDNIHMDFVDHSKIVKKILICSGANIEENKTLKYLLIYDN
jgi:hypothetical protein